MRQGMSAKGGAARPCLFIAFLMLVASGAVAGAQTPGKIDLEATELAAELIGAPVFSSDGHEIGVLADLSMSDDGRVDKLRVTTAAALGFGSRAVEIREGGFTLLRGAVVLDLPAELIGSLPSMAPEGNRAEENRPEEEQQ